MVFMLFMLFMLFFILIKKLKKKINMNNSLKARQNIRESTISNFPKAKIYTISKNQKKYKFMMLDSLYNLVEHHFSTNTEIKFINNTNNKNNSNKIKDFRNSSHFRDNFLNTSEKTNLILFNLYVDSTNLSRNKKKKKDCLCVYITFLNDVLQKINKKIMYNFASISGEIIKKIGLQTFLKLLFRKIKEIEQKNLKILQNNVKIFLFNVLGDNQEIYSILNYKLSF
jgi:hypothetical protein